jgi:hypothetical protein
MSNVIIKQAFLCVQCSRCHNYIRTENVNHREVCGITQAVEKNKTVRVKKHKYINTNIFKLLGFEYNKLT